MTEMTSEALTALYDLGAREPKPINGLPDDRVGFILPEGYRFHEIRPDERKLPRIKQIVNVHDVDSFIAYLNEFKANNTRIFAEPGFLSSTQQPVMMAIVDYHKPTDGAGEPDYGVHAIHFRPRYSDQWIKWTEACDGMMEQAEFAEFIEENRRDIVEPEAATLLDLVRVFKATKKVAFDSVDYKQDGSVLLHYSEEVKQETRGPANTTLPETFQVGLPVYFRDERIKFGVMIRFKVLQGKVVFGLKFDPVASVIEDNAFEELTKKVIEETGLPLHIGSPHVTPLSTRPR